MNRSMSLVDLLGDHTVPIERRTVATITGSLIFVPDKVATSMYV